MRNRKKQLLLLLVFVALLFLASGCTSPVDPETKEVIQITSENLAKINDALASTPILSEREEISFV